MEPAAMGGELDQRGAVFDHGVAEPQVEGAEFFLRVGPDEDDGAARTTSFIVLGGGSEGAKRFGVVRVRFWSYASHPKASMSLLRAGMRRESHAMRT